MTSNPYRTQIEVPVTHHSNSDRIFYVEGESKLSCPVCKKSGSSDPYSSFHFKSKLCTPFNRIILIKYLFKKNLICNLSGAHLHCWCFDKTCKTHWVVVINNNFEVKEI